MGQGIYYPSFDRLKRLPLLSGLYQKERRNYFLSPAGGGLHYGRYASFAAARAALPTSAGFGNESVQDEFVAVRTQRVYAFDYPMMFWLREAFGLGARSIYDFGGSVGVHYYAYQRYMSFPEGLVWRVCELPEVCRIGRELAAKQSPNGLVFFDSADTSSIRDDIWILGGVLEFLEGVRLDDMLSRAARKPGHLLLNKLPLHEGDDFVSTQNIGNGSFVPHYVFNRQRFIASIEACGYELKDSWGVPERAFQDPSNPGHDFEEYSGLYFRQR